MAAGLKEYNGVVLGPNGSKEVIRAKDLMAAKAQMTRKHGPEFEGGMKRWACGRTPQSLTGHAVRP